jgi:thymidylate synthase
MQTKTCQDTPKIKEVHLACIPQCRVFTTPSDAYLAELENTLLHPHFECAPRDQKIRERLNVMFTVTQPTDGPLVTRDPARNAVLADYHAKEMALYASGTRDAADFTKASKFWSAISNPDGTVNSAYGWLIDKDPSCGVKPDVVTPWTWAREALEKDLDTRQAILKFHKREFLSPDVADQVCTMHAVFHVRYGKLHMTTVMRSNDVCRGLAYDLPYFCHLQLRMRDELNHAGHPVTLGSYTHVAHSLHLYERDLDKAYAMLALTPPAS